MLSNIPSDLHTRVGHQSDTTLFFGGKEETLVSIITIGLLHGPSQPDVSNLSLSVNVLVYRQHLNHNRLLSPCD